MTTPSLWQRLRSARVVQVAAVYLAGSWMVLQIVDTLQGLLTLPEWVGPVAVVLLLVGLLVVGATAWVQALPQTTKAEEAGEVPTDWEVAPADVWASLREGRLPHLTWGRAITGGVVAMSLLFGIAGFAVLVRSPGAIVGPREAGAESAVHGIAVLPFHMSGEGLDVYREGMVDLMSANLDGLSEYRAIDARTLLARWNRDVGETADVELDRALRVAASTGARYAVVGSGVLAGPRIRLDAAIYDLADGSQVGDGGQVEGAQEDVLGLVDALTVEVMRSILDATGQGSLAQTFRLASLLTESVPALRYYLEGDALFRRARFDEARDALQRAVDEDPDFALAHWRLGETYGWQDGIASPENRRHKARAQELADRLPEREATLLTITSAIGSQALGAEEMELLRAYVRRYPDDPDGWYLFGEAGLHGWTLTGISDEELEEALYRTVELDPTFGPYYEHALHWATAKGQEERYEALLAGAEEVGDATERTERMRLRWALFQGEDVERTEAEARLAALEPRDQDRVDQSAIGLLDVELDRLLPLWDDRNRREALLLQLYDQQGRLGEMIRVSEGLGDGQLVGAVWRLFTWAKEGHVPEEHLRAMDDALGPVTPEEGFRYLARAALDDLLGRNVDVEGIHRSVDRDMDEFLPMFAAEFDTTGFRDMAHVDAELFYRVAAGREEAQAFYHDLAEALASVQEPPTGTVIGLGWAALEGGLFEEAAEALEGVSRSRERTLVMLRLGRAYEGLGRTEDALRAYRTFLSRTAPADEGLGAVEVAREAVRRLGG